nr:hypothetical protein Iba_chr03dCG4310 [Ipomoea batatas]
MIKFILLLPRRNAITYQKARILRLRFILALKTQLRGDEIRAFDESLPGPANGSATQEGLHWEPDQHLNPQLFRQIVRHLLLCFINLSSTATKQKTSLRCVRSVPQADIWNCLPFVLLIALSNLRRTPTAKIPISLRSSRVSKGKVSSSTSCISNNSAYFPNPISSSHSPTPFIVYSSRVSPLSPSPVDKGNAISASSQCSFELCTICTLELGSAVSIAIAQASSLVHVVSRPEDSSKPHFNVKSSPTFLAR